MPSAVWPGVGWSSSVWLPSSHCPGTGSWLGPGQAERARPLHVVLVVEGAQLALGRPGLGAQALRRGLTAADAGVGEGVAAEQVRVGAGCDEQALHLRERGLRQQRGQGLELGRQHR